MSNQNIKGKDEIGVFALGGLGEVGKNMYCIEYLNQIFIIDSGILFPDEHLLGVDYVIPDYQYLIENQEKIVGLFITHGHEDHIGGIPFMLKKVRIPKIYAAGVAIELIKNKLQEYKDIKVPQIIEFKAHYKYTFKGDVELSFIRMCHSIPDSYAFVFKTPLGNIVTTGDFKIDLTPLGPGTEFDKLANLGQEGVLLLMADSTNACVEGNTQSERRIGESIRELFTHIDSRIIVATFASNIYRVQQIVEASVINNRKVAIFGRSMKKTIEVGQQIGYIKAPKSTFIEDTELNQYKPEELTLLFDQAAWLQAMDKRILLWQLPIEVRILILIPPSIKPDTSHLTVVGKKFCKLVVHKLIVTLPVTLWIRAAGTSTCSSPNSILTIPVDMRVIKVQSDALLVALIRQLLHDVAVERSSIYYIIIRILGLEHRESLVVASGEADVLGTRSLDGSHPFGSIKLRRIETASQLGILLVVQVLIGHCPFAGSEHAVQSPMQEDTELIVLELLAGFQVFCRWLIMLSLIFLGSIIRNHSISRKARATQSKDCGT